MNTEGKTIVNFKVKSTCPGDQADLYLGKPVMLPWQC